MRSILTCPPSQALISFLASTPAVQRYLASGSREEIDLLQQMLQQLETIQGFDLPGLTPWQTGDHGNSEESPPPKPVSSSPPDGEGKNSQEIPDPRGSELSAPEDSCIFDINDSTTSTTRIRVQAQPVRTTVLAPQPPIQNVSIMLEGACCMWWSI